MDTMNDRFKKKSSKVASSRTEEERKRAGQEAIETFERIGQQAREAGLTEEIIEEELRAMDAEKKAARERDNKGAS